MCLFGFGMEWWLGSLFYVFVGFVIFFELVVGVNIFMFGLVFLFVIFGVSCWFFGFGFVLLYLS